MNDYLTHYKPTKRAWIPLTVAIFVVGLIAITWIASGGKFNLRSTLEIELGGPDIYITPQAEFSGA